MVPELQGLAVPERQVLAWLQPERPEIFQPDKFPVFNLLVPEGRFYGFPVHGVPGFKFGLYHHFEEQGNAGTFDWEPRWDDEEVLREFAARYFPQGAGPTMSLKTCMFTNSPDKHFIIDLHPTYPQVSFAAGFSGHGYKFASVIGEIMADLAERRQCRHNISLFSLERFTGQVSELHRYRPGEPRQGWSPHLLHGATNINQRMEMASSRRNWGGQQQQRSRYTGRQRPQQQRAQPRRMARPQPKGRQQSSFQNRHGYQDTTDPLYWDRDAVDPFW
jgi:hypothetical protein